MAKPSTPAQPAIKDSPTKQAVDASDSHSQTTTQVRHLMRQDMETRMFQMTADWPFHVLPNEPLADDLIKQISSAHYIDKRWRVIPRNPREESELYPAFIELLNDMFSIVGSNDQRAVLDTSGSKMRHVEGPGKRLYSACDLMVVAALPEQNGLQPGADFSEHQSYAKGLVAIEVKMDRTLSSDYIWHDQLSVYAREILTQQPTRLYCYCLILTEENVRVYLYTRSGAFYSPWIDIHKDRETFVKIVLRTCSLDAAQQGFDPFFRRVDNFGVLAKVPPALQKLHGTDACDAVCMGGRPILRRHVIHGRSTTCWIARVTVAGQRRQWLIKDSWPSTHRKPSEIDLLDLARGIDGVGQIIHHEPSIMTVASICKISPQNEGFVDRRLQRVFLEAYGPPIAHFQTRIELVEALIDAIRGHKTLYIDKWILHRDVSWYNILLAGAMRRARNRGILVDFDHAIQLPRDKDQRSFDERTGTRLFQSLNMLSPLGQASPHDYLDDLESFFWVFCVLCMSVDDLLQPMYQNTALYQDWSNPIAELAAEEKILYLHERTTDVVLSSYMQALKPTLEKLRRLCSRRDMDRQEQRLAQKRQERERKLALEASEGEGQVPALVEPPTPMTRDRTPEQLSQIHADYDVFLEHLEDCLRVLGTHEQRDIEQKAQDKREAAKTAKARRKVKPPIFSTKTSAKAAPDSPKDMLPTATGLGGDQASADEDSSEERLTPPSPSAAAAERKLGAKRRAEDRSSSSPPGNPEGVLGAMKRPRRFSGASQSEMSEAADEETAS